MFRGVIRCFVIVSLSTVSGAQLKSDKKPKYPVSMSVHAGKVESDGTRTLEVVLQLDDEWSVFANPVGVKELTFAETVLKVHCGGVSALVSAKYPNGDVVKDPAAGDYGVYKGKVTLTAKVKRPEGEEGPLVVSVYVQPVNLVRGVCTHLPKTLRAKVE
jgi:hypothetical protein